MRLFLLALLSLMPFAAPVGAAEADVASELRNAQRMGWNTANILALAMAGSDAKRFPAMHAWLKEFRAAGGLPAKRAADAPVPRFDVERLVTRNPAFWRAYFELAPADGGAMLLHASLLLAAGEASRAAYVLVIARQNPDINQSMHGGMNALLEQSQQLLVRAAREVAEAAKLHDEGGPAAANTRLRALLGVWPASGLAHYELGLALLAQQYADAGRRPPARARLSVHSELAPSGPAAASYARARLHDPLLIRAYQGDDGATTDALLTFGKTVRPLWETVARDTLAETRDDTLNTLAGALQQVGVPELALAVFQVLVAREGGSYDEDDRKFVAATLRALAPAAVDPVTKRLSLARSEFAKLIMP